jgi:hypothetical protein
MQSLSRKSTCAVDLEAGMNDFGGFDHDDPELAILRRGGVVILPCPACTFETTTVHFLSVRIAPGVGGDGDRYVVADQ